MPNRKRLSLLLLCALMVTILASCGYMQGSVTIKSDGSGTIVEYAGYTEEYFNQAVASGGSISANGKELTKDNAEVRTINGTRYYGSSEAQSFASIAELNKLLSGEDSSAGTYQVTKLDNGFAFTIEVGADDVESAKYMQQLGVAAEISITGPGYWAQTSGYQGLVQMTNSALVFNPIALAQRGATTYRFENIASNGNYWTEPSKENPGSSSSGGSTTTTTPTKDYKYFTDVTNNQWYAPAVNWAYEQRYVSGIGDNKFAPNNKLSGAEYCTLICRVRGLQQQKQATDTFWAAPYIRTAVAAGLVGNHGDPNDVNTWGRPMTRQESIYYLASTSTVSYQRDKLLTSSDIPDWNQILVQFQEGILKAYNEGWLDGVDSRHTFAPNNTLTRAEFCQLIYSRAQVKDKVRTDFYLPYEVYMIEAGGYNQIEAKDGGRDVNFNDCTFKVSKSSIAEIDKNGIIRGKSAGTTDFTITKGKASLKGRIVVVEPGNDKLVLSLNKDLSDPFDDVVTTTQKVGTKLTLHTVNAYYFTSKGIVYSSSDDKIASVTDKGVITCNREGTCTIKSKLGNAEVELRLTVTKR